jgi:hypothetical protein
MVFRRVILRFRFLMLPAIWLLFLVLVPLALWGLKAL